VAVSRNFDTSEVRRLATDLGRQGSAGSVGAKGSRLLRRTASDIERDAKIAAPVDTGRLKESISVDITGDGRFGTIAAEVGPTAFYGHYVEEGTSKQAPQPFLGPAFDRHAQTFAQRVAAIAEDIL
jgi:HK97 gp10 family phage protein